MTCSTLSRTEQQIAHAYGHKIICLIAGCSFGLAGFDLIGAVAS